MVKRVDISAAELYDVKDEYVNFRQKNHMALQPKWNPEFEDLEKNRFARPGHPSFNLLDWAFDIGSASVQKVLGFPMHNSDQKGNSWKPATKGPFAEGVKWETDSQTATNVIKKAVKYFGADAVGICELDRRWVYSHYFDEDTKEEHPIKFSDEPGYEKYDKPIKLNDGTRVIPKEMKYVIVLIHDMDREAMQTGPTLVQEAATRLAYSNIGVTGLSTAEFIRSLGYNAIPSSNDIALNIPLAVDAGLGELGRNAKLITPKFGPRCRISKVFTDLPLVKDKPIVFGAVEFCRTCKKCAERCPSRSIPDGDRSFEPAGPYSNKGVLQWQLEHDKCRRFWSKVGNNCGLCISVCPFNKGSGKIHDAARFLIENVPALNPVILKFDELFAYGKLTNTKVFWNIEK